MKLKKKLAREAAVVSSRNYDPSESFLEGFLAGFEKAREMTADLFRGSLNNDRYLGRLYPEATNLIADDMISVGEDEVE